MVFRPHDATMRDDSWEKRRMPLHIRRGITRGYPASRGLAAFGNE